MTKRPEAMPIILQALEEGCTNLEACKKAGINKETFYAWMREKSDFSDLVQRAKQNALANSIAKVERSLLERALGFEYEEVASEYVSKPVTGDDGKETYIPTINKQKRTKKRIVQDVEAIKFFLTNKAPQDWKNRQENVVSGDLFSKLRVVREHREGDKAVPRSEDEIPE